MHCFKLFIQAYRHSSPKFTSPSFPSPPLKELAVLSMTKTYDQLENRRLEYRCPEAQCSKIPLEMYI
jgi:hypothetical protein